MPKIKWGTSLDEAAVRIAQERAEAAGQSVGDWVARAIRAQAMREGTRALYDALDAEPKVQAEWNERAEANERETTRLIRENGTLAA
ncbi:MAG: hypothetical protein FWJ93_12155 [Micromonosporaceae bacterium]